MEPLLSFVVHFTADQAATFLRRAKNLKLESAKDCRQLTQEIVQDVNSHLANGNVKHALRFLRGETTTEEQRTAKPCSKKEANDNATPPTVAAAAPSSAVGAVAAPVGAVAPPIAANPPPQNADAGDLGSGVRKPWSQLSSRKRRSRALVASKPYQKVLWTGFVVELAVFRFMDDKVSRAPSTDDKGSEGSRQVVEVVTPYDVIDRLRDTSQQLRPSMTVQAHHNTAGRAQQSGASEGGR